MRSLAETAKDGSLAHTADSGVVLRHRAAALPVPASLWTRQQHTARRRAQRRLGQQLVLCTTIALIQGVLQKVFF